MGATDYTKRTKKGRFMIIYLVQRNTDKFFYMGRHYTFSPDEQRAKVYKRRSDAFRAIARQEQRDKRRVNGFSLLTYEAKPV
jgi:hypothetical protein